jgi:RhtB (resistance to homoserine/threonine) family protein
VALDLGPFLAISILLIVIPGPDTAVVTTNALVGGRRGGILAAVGVAIGLAVWTLAAALGIAALLRASEVGFTALKLIGAAYLIWIGVQMLRTRIPTGAVQPRRSAQTSLRQGLISDLGNPKIAVFFTSFLPQFVGSHSPAFASLLALGLIFCVLTLAWLIVYATLVGEGAAVLRRPRVRRALDRFTGVVLIGFGVRLALERR